MTADGGEGTDVVAVAQVERFTHALFGIAARGAHATAYMRDGDDGEIKLWVPRRARHLFNYPGKLDSTIAGGVKASDSPLECIVAEGQEEASLPSALLRDRLKAVGALSYVTTYNASSSSGSGGGSGSYAGEKGLVSPEILYCFDLELPADVIPRPCDDEVEEFCLMTVAEVRS